MTYLMMVRYRDGRDKIIEIPSRYCPLVFPTLVQKSRTTPIYETYLELSDVVPVQVVNDVKNNQHWIRIDEILDVTVEEIE